MTQWHTTSVDEALSHLSVDPGRGLSAEEVRARAAEHGPNTLTEEERLPPWRKVLALLNDQMTIVLVIAAIVSAVVSREWETPVVILVVIVLNTWLNYVQEAKAEDSLAALQQMSVTTSRVRRDGRESQVDRTEIVPGDVILLEAGDSVPADGRIVAASRLSVAEAALTGEALPVDKGTAALDDADAPLGDRSNMLFMNTEVTRGRAEMVVTATGMDSEIGSIAEMLSGAGQEKTPLQRRIDHLARILTIIALVVVAVVFVIGLIRGQSWSELLITAVSLAVATIPEGLTAVVAFTLAMGASRLARRGAIIKQLSAVETLGSTSQIATDKTGTLTLNEMTVERLFVPGHRYRVTGQGYSTDGRLLSTSDDDEPDLRYAFLAMGLCNDAVLRDGSIVGDPTDGALVVLAEKGGIDVEGARRDRQREAEVPFDSDYKFQATVHRHPRRDGYWMCVKGAPGTLMERATTIRSAEGTMPFTAEESDRLQDEVDALAARGLRTLMIAGRDLDEVPDEVFDEVGDLTLYALVGIVDPPRSEVADAIEEAHGAGISVHMITGDHLVTASAIAEQLGIPGDAASGSDLDDFDDVELQHRAGGFGVLARVAPEHKIRVVKALQQQGSVVAMTGDGVNDAPALKQADIGIAMGITGTDVSKGAARMILTDDNFATIVAAIREGRGIYANILRFVRFQLTTAWGFVALFLVCSVFGIAGGAPFTALQILWVNIIMDGPPALALGVEPTEPDVMRRPPRPVREHLLTRQRIALIVSSAAIMTAVTLLVLWRADDWFPESAGDPLFTTTLAFNTFVFLQLFNLMNVRGDHSVFSTRTFTNPAIWLALTVVLVLQVLVIQADVMQGLFDTTALTSQQWALSIGLGSIVLWVDEIRQLVANARARRRRRA